MVRECEAGRAPGESLTDRGEIAKVAPTIAAAMRAEEERARAANVSPFAYR